MVLQRTEPEQESDPPREAIPAVRHWAVARTKSRCEKLLEEFFAERRVPSFLPLLNKRRAYGRHVRSAQIPLFPGYIFFDRELISNPDVFASRKVAQILVPADSAELTRELGQIARALTCDQSLRETVYGQVGRMVMVRSGPMKGLSGEVIRLGSQSKLILRVTFLQKAVELGIDEAFVEPVL